MNSSSTTFLTFKRDITIPFYTNALLNQDKPSLRTCDEMKDINYGRKRRLNNFANQLNPGKLQSLI